MGPFGADIAFASAIGSLKCGAAARPAKGGGAPKYATTLRRYAPRKLPTLLLKAAAAAVATALMRLCPVERKPREPPGEANLHLFA